jgi:hypothetical protein
MKNCVDSSQEIFQIESLYVSNDGSQVIVHTKHTDRKDVP